MNKRKHAIQINGRDLAQNNKRIASQYEMNDPIIISMDSGMTRDEERQIIIDAVRDYVLSCDSNEATDFIGELTDIIVHACIEVL